MQTVTKEQFYEKINPLNVQGRSYFTTNDKRDYLDMRQESAKVLCNEVSLKNGTLIGKTSIDYALPYNQQKTIYELV